MLSLSISAAWKSQRDFRAKGWIGAAYRVSNLAQPLLHTHYTRRPLYARRPIALRQPAQAGEALRGIRRRPRLPAPRVQDLNGTLRTGQ